MNDVPATRPSLPLVRLNLAAPLVCELERRHIDHGDALRELSLTRAAFDDPETLVSAPEMYAIVERLALTSGDRYFGVRVGEQLDPFAWSPMIVAAQQSRTVGEFLLRFIVDAERDASSVTYLLKTMGPRSTFHERRFTDGGVFPGHNDGFTVAYLLTIIRKAVGPQWSGKKVIVQVCDPSVIPPDYLGIRVAARDTLGASISFPTKWLLARPALDSLMKHSLSADIESAPSTQIVDAFRQALLPHIHEFDLHAGRVAEICGLNRRTLARRMQQRGTSVQKEVASLRRSCAERELQSSKKPIAVIAAEVGYSDPAVFSRAFKRWTGMSPREYRKRHREA